MLTQNRISKMQNADSTNTETQLQEQLELLSKQTSPSPRPARATRARASRTAPAQPSHGYSDDSLTNDSSDSAPLAPITNNNIADPEAHIHPDLRAARISLAPVVNMMPAGVPPPTALPGPSPGSSNPIPPPAHLASGPMAASLDDPSADGRKAKRELSQSKRAAQNRAAQRAFRQRKEGYIKKLEQQVRDYIEMEHTYKTMQAENYALREYVIHLQSRLLDAQGEYPQPPPNVNLSQPPSAPPAVPASAAEQVASNPAAGTPLEAVAQAVAGLAAQEQLAERHQYANKSFAPDPVKDDATRTAEEIDRQLRTDGLPAPTASM